jgi:hypothetical protein
MDERIDTFLTDILELEGVSAASIRDGVRTYLVVYENLVRDTEPDPKNRDAAARVWRKLCRQKVAEEITNHTGTPLGEFWKLVLSALDSTGAPPTKN